MSEKKNVGTSAHCIVISKNAHPVFLGNVPSSIAVTLEPTSASWWEMPWWSQCEKSKKLLTSNGYVSFVSSSTEWLFFVYFRVNLRFRVHVTGVNSNTKMQRGRDVGSQWFNDTNSNVYGCTILDITCGRNVTKCIDHCASNYPKQITRALLCSWAIEQATRLSALHLLQEGAPVVAASRTYALFPCRSSLNCTMFVSGSWTVQGRPERDRRRPFNAVLARRS